MFAKPQSSPSTTYRVTIGSQPSCEYEDFALTAKPCKHVIAARLVCERDHGGKATNIVTDEVPSDRRSRRTGPRTTSRRRRRSGACKSCCTTCAATCPNASGRRTRPASRTLSRDCRLRDGVQGLLRPQFPPVLHATCWKRTRRASSRKPIPGAKVTAFFEDAYFTPILKELIGFSARPLRAVETDFAIDSQRLRQQPVREVVRSEVRRHPQQVRLGQGAYRLRREDERRDGRSHSRQGRGRLPAVRAARQGNARSTSRSAKCRPTRRMLSLENFEAVADCGGQAFIAFKSNTHGRRRRACSRRRSTTSSSTRKSTWPTTTSGSNVESPSPRSSGSSATR